MARSTSQGCEDYLGASGELHPDTCPVLAHVRHDNVPLKPRWLLGQHQSQLTVPALLVSTRAGFALAAAMDHILDVVVNARRRAHIPAPEGAVLRQRTNLGGWVDPDLSRTGDVRPPYVVCRYGGSGTRGIRV